MPSVLKWVVFAAKWVFTSHEGRAALRVLARQQSGAEKAEKAVKKAVKVLTPIERLTASRADLATRIRMLKAQPVIDRKKLSGLEEQLVNVVALLRAAGVLS